MLYRIKVLSSFMNNAIIMLRHPDQFIRKSGVESVRKLAVHNPNSAAGTLEPMIEAIAEPEEVTPELLKAIDQAIYSYKRDVFAKLPPHLPAALNANLTELLELDDSKIVHQAANVMETLGAKISHDQLEQKFITHNHDIECLAFCEPPEEKVYLLGCEFQEGQHDSIGDDEIV